MSRSLQGAPLMAYSDPPVRKRVREMVTSLYSMGSALSALSMVSGYMGSAQWRPARGTCEDDVFHLAAAEGFCALLSHDPGQGVHHIGFARSVGTDDGSDARLEVEGRGRRKRLESSDSQTFQVQGASVLLGGPGVCIH